MNSHMIFFNFFIFSEIEGTVSVSNSIFILMKLNNIFLENPSINRESVYPK